jgi:hypothetical protein
MLAVTANWNLSDGTLVAPRTAAAQGWLAAIRRAAIRAGFGRDGRYRPVESICLVLAGDTFDWLMSTRWASQDRPWHAGTRGRAARAEVSGASLQAARPVLRRLRRWIRAGVPLPVGDARGRPSVHEIRHAPIRVVLLVGDRDAWISEGFDQATTPANRFGVLAGESWSDARVSIRHGHDLDPLWHAMPTTAMPAIGRSPTLGESLAVDLVVPFAVAMQDEAAMWSLAKSRIGSLAAAPPLKLPGDVARLVIALGPASGMARRLLTMWRRCVETWHARARRDPPVSETSYDPLDALAAWLDAAASVHASRVPPAIAHLAIPHGAVPHLAIPRASPEQPLAVLGHVPSSGVMTGLGGVGGPWLTVVEGAAGPGWIEPLGMAACGPSVVAIGAASGRSVVEAA